MVIAADIVKDIKSSEVKFVDFRFTDMLGKVHHITYSASAVGVEELERGIMFDGSSIAGWKSIEASDMIIKPDLSTAFIDPFTSQPTLILMCDVLDPETKNGYECDPRSIARKAATYLSESRIGDIAYFGPELEFFIFDDVRFRNLPNDAGFIIDAEENLHNSHKQYDAGNLGHRASPKQAYCTVPPVDLLHDIRSEMITALESIGLKPLLHHHEVAESQCEVGFCHAALLQSADNVQKAKYAVKNVAASYGKSATFMPKPIFGDNGSGMHVHQSIWRDGTNLFFDKNGEYAELSEACLYYIGGIIKHARAINAFSNPTTNSYKRLVPGYEAPTYLSYSARNRSAAIRIPYVHSAAAKRVEVRFPDPSANPYLTFAAMMMAGIDGIKNKIHPGKATDTNLYSVSASEAAKIPAVCTTLEEALAALDSDRGFLKASGVFTDTIIDSYITLLRKDAEEIKRRPHPMEFQLYYAS